MDFAIHEDPELTHAQERLARFNIPLHVVSHSPRRTLPERILGLLKDWKATHLFANIEYEVDELRRDTRICELAAEEAKVQCTFVHDRCIITPGVVKTKEGRGYTVSRI